GPCAEGAVASWIHLSDTNCLPSQLPLLRIISPKRARSCELIHSPPPQRVPPLTDSTGFPSISTVDFGPYPCHFHSLEAPILSMMFSFNACGSPLPNTRASERANRLMRTSLYS